MNGLKAYLQIVIEETVKEELQKALPPTSQPFAGMSPQIASIGYRLSEIEMTLTDFSHSLDGKNFSAASKSLILETQRNRQGMISAIERLQLQADENKAFISNAVVALQRMEKRASQQIVEAVGQIAGDSINPRNHTDLCVRARTGRDLSPKSEYTPQTPGPPVIEPGALAVTTSVVWAIAYLTATNTLSANPGRIARTPWSAVADGTSMALFPVAVPPL